MTTAITKRPEGRPTKYIPDTIYPKINEYLDGCGRNQTELPTVEGLALKLGVNTDTLWEWNKKYPEFSEYIKKVATKQKDQLINDGMYGGKEVNASMAIFLLKAIHGYKDQNNVTNIQVNVKPILGGATLVDVRSDNSDKEVTKA
jgi:hypothetical protein